MTDVLPFEKVISTCLPLKRPDECFTAVNLQRLCLKVARRRSSGLIERALNESAPG